MTIEFEAIGTKWQIEINQPFTDSVLREQISQRIDTYDQIYSRFKHDSTISRIAKSGGHTTLPPDSQELFELYQKLYQLTGGKVTPLIGNTLEAAGYNAEYSLQPQTVIPTAPKWDAVIDFKYPHLSLRQPMTLDFGAAGKGHLIDIIAQLLRDNGISEFVIDASGDILHSSHKATPLQIGLEHPSLPDTAIGVLNIHNQAVCSSAINRRSWHGMHHVFDPDTARPTEGIVATWVVADTAIIADGLATALFFTKPQKLQSAFDFEYCIVADDLTYQCSTKLPVTMFS